VSQIRVVSGPVSSLRTPSGRKTDPARLSLKHGEPQTQLRSAFSGGQVYVNRRSRVENGNPGYYVVLDTIFDIGMLWPQISIWAEFRLVGAVSIGAAHGAVLKQLHFLQPTLDIRIDFMQNPE
jgi:hypothetical protein